MDGGAGSIGRQIAKGAAWMILMRVSVRLIAIVSTIILARLLVPADFGLVAMAMMVYALIDTMGEFNFDVVLIREQQSGREYYDTAWTLSVLRGLVAGAILCALALPMAGFYDEPRLEAIMYVLALSAVLGGLTNVGIVDFRKSFHFRKDFWFMVTAKVFAFVVTLVLAFHFRSYWALVLGSTGAVLVRVVLSYAMHPFRPRLSLSKAGEILHFSKWLLLNNVLDYFAKRSDVFIIGKFVGAAPLGLYTVAMEIATLATSDLVAPIRRAIFPGYARIADDRAALRREFLSGLALIVMLSAPVAAGIGIVADPLVRVFLGTKWLAAIPLVQILSAVGLLQVCHSNTYPAYLACGRPKLTTYIYAMQSGVGIVLLVWLTHLWGATGAAWALVCATFVTMIANFHFAIGLLGTRWSELVVTVWRSVAAIAAMLIAVEALNAAFAVPETLLWETLRLVSDVGIGAAAYVGVHLALWRCLGCPAGPEQQVLGLVRQRLAQSRVAPAAR